MSTTNSKVGRTFQSAEYYMKKNAVVIPTVNPQNIYDKYTREFSNLRAQNLKEYMEQRLYGLNFNLSLLMDEIRRRDTRIGGICQTRKLAVLGATRKLTVTGEWKEGVEYAEKQLKLLRKRLANLFTDMVEANIQGLSAFEINFVADGGKIYMESLKRITNDKVVYDELTDSYRYLDMRSFDPLTLNARDFKDGRLRYDMARFPFIDIPAYKIMEVHSLDGDAANGFRNGCTDGLIWGYFFKNWTIKDLAMFIEKFSKPSVLGFYDEYMNPDDRKALESAVKAILNNASATAPKGSDIKLLSDIYKASTATIHQQFIDYWDKEMTIRVLGQELTTDIGDIGSKAAVEAAAKFVRADIINSDKELIVNHLNEQMERMIDINFANPGDYPVIDFTDEADLDANKTRSETYASLYTAGWRVKKKFIEEQFEVEVEEVIPVSPAAAPAQEPEAEGGEESTEEGKEDGKEDGKEERKDVKAEAPGDMTDATVEEYLESLWKAVIKEVA